MIDSILDSIRQLSLAFGVSGHEGEVRNIIRGRLAALDVRLETDALGNLSAVLNEGRDFSVMVDAHMDEVGLMVSCVEEDGRLRFVTLGGWDTRVLPAHQVELLSRHGKIVQGVIGTPPPHTQGPEEQKKPFQVEDLFIDVGASSGEEAEGLGITVGVPGVLSVPFTRLAGGTFTGKALDDRVGCALLVALMEHFSRQPPDYTLVANFSVQEETGLRGATTAANRIRPDLAFAVEGTTGDTPGFPKHRRPAQVGFGPAVTVADRSILVRPELVEFILEVAKELEIRHQVKRPLTGGTNAGAIHLSGSGVLTAVVSVPCRYIHSPVSLACEQDVLQTYALLRALLDRARSIPKRCNS